MRESKLLSVLTADRKANIMQDLWSRVTPAAWLTLAALPSTNPRFWHWVMINNALQAAADEVLYTEEARTARKHTLEPDDELGLPTNPQEVKHFRRTAPEPDIMLDSML